jgi:hypothetical protein
MESYKKVELMLGMAILAVVALWVFASFFNNDENKLYVEYLKLTYQFFLLVVIGAAVTLLFSEYTRTQQKTEEARSRKQEQIAAKKEIYRKFLTDYESAYNSAKRIRRLLRAGSRSIQSNESNLPEKSTPEKIMIDKDAYQEQIKALINVQLDFEYLEKLAETDFFLGVPEQKSLISNLDKIEKYLNKLVNEYERSYEIFSGKSSVPITQLPDLEEFIRSYKLACDFREMFKYPDKEIQSILITLLLKNE